MSKVLIMHHVEPMWSDAMQKNHCLTFYDLQERLLLALEGHSFDRIILTRFEDYKLSPEYYPEFACLIDDVYDYGYGWELNDEYEDLGDGRYHMHECFYCDGGIHSPVVLLADWMYELGGDDVTICGAFDGECIEDLEIALDFIGVSYTRWNEFIF